MRRRSYFKVCNLVYSLWRFEGIQDLGLGLRDLFIVLCVEETYFSDLYGSYDGWKL